MKRIISPWDSCIFKHRFEPLFEFAAVFRSGDERAHVQRNQPFVLQALGHVAAQNSLGQSLDDGGLANPGVADEHRIIFAAPRQHLNHAANFLVAADHRVELAVGGEFSEVAAVLLQSFVGCFRILRRDPLIASYVFERRGQFFARDTQFRSTRPAAPLSSVMTRSKCSIETYSSLSFLASSSACASKLFKRPVI